METAQRVEYAIEYLDDDGRWKQLEASRDEAEIRDKWRKLDEMGARRRRRLVELSVLRED